jgi:hypothetical protein
MTRPLGGRKAAASEEEARTMMRAFANSALVSVTPYQLPVARDHALDNWPIW